MPTAAAAAAEARQVYRQLLRAVDRHVTSVTGNPAWRSFVAAEFRRPQQAEGGDAGAAAEAAAARLQLARDYALLITSVRDHKELLLSYNIGLDVDSREKQMNQRAANLVGLAIPPKSEDHPGE